MRGFVIFLGLLLMLGGGAVAGAQYAHLVNFDLSTIKVLDQVPGARDFLNTPMALYAGGGAAGFGFLLILIAALTGGKKKHKDVAVVKPPSMAPEAKRPMKPKLAVAPEPTAPQPMAPEPAPKPRPAAAAPAPQPAAQPAPRPAAARPAAPQPTQPAPQPAPRPAPQPAPRPAAPQAAQSAPQPAAPRPAPAQPAAPRPAPQAAASQPQPAALRPAAPRPAAPQQAAATPQAAAPQPAAPPLAKPQASAQPPGAAPAPAAIQGSPPPDPRVLNRKRIQDLVTINDAIKAYQAKTGAFPKADKLAGANERGAAWIPGLSPDFVKDLPRDPQHAAATQYVYVSDGANYKLLAQGVSLVGSPNVEVLGIKIDNTRNPTQQNASFGFWTPGFAEA